MSPEEALRLRLALDALVDGIESVDERAPCIDLTVCLDPDTAAMIRALYP